MCLSKDNNRHIVRYVVKADGHEVARFSNEYQAWKYAWKYEDSCIHQDEPFYPKMVVEEEEIEETT